MVINKLDSSGSGCFRLICVFGFYYYEFLSLLGEKILKSYFVLVKRVSGLKVHYTHLKKQYSHESSCSFMAKLLLGSIFVFIYNICFNDH